jgi:hypothetical protein
MRRSSFIDADRDTVLGMKRFLFLAALIVGCSSSNEEQPDYQYGRSDVESALVGTWTGSFASGRAGTLELNLALAAPGAQTKCGNRTLSMKCMDSSSASLTGTLTTSDGQLSALPATGELTIFGTTFTNGSLYLKTASGLTLSAQYEAGTLRNGTLSDTSSTATFTLARK